MPPSSSCSEKLPIPAPNIPQRKTIACRPCHARKIRCSGNKPCNNCTRVSECIYPTRDRQVRVHQSFLDRILQENADLRALQNQAEALQKRPPVKDSWDPPTIPHDDEVSSENQPILEESDWFAHIRTSDTPIWIGEISDSAFATRFRQFASFSQVPSHIPRTQFASEDGLRGLAAASPTWPSLSRGRLLLETALQFLQHNYHVVRRSEVFSHLRTPGLGQANPSVQAKMWALFAIGELRLNKCLTATGHLPGLAYFAIASDTIRMINERPQIDVIETVLLLVSSLSSRSTPFLLLREGVLALYSLETNRRHSACTYVGTALRLATIMGLHVNIGPSFITNPDLREHRIRLWWSVYIIDRFLSSKIGLPLLISDADISVDLPSNNSGLNLGDFGDHLHFVATLRLAKIAGHISRSLYVRTPQRGTFLQQVGQILRELDQWKEQLPIQLKTAFDCKSGNERLPQPLSLLRLSFNQLFIIATRPVLLFVFRRYIEERAAAMAELALPGHTMGIAEACISTARHSCELLSQCWVNGDFHIFDYFYVQHLFSTAVILAIAGALGRQTSPEDNDEYNLAVGFLQQLEQNGNYAAMEFYSHIEGIQSTLTTLRSTHTLPAGLPRPGDGMSQHLINPAHHSSNEKGLAIPSSAGDAYGPQAPEEVGLDLSFIDDWIYDDALEKLCW